jgi:dihydroxyacid dehydratase/phosphogluconate dehydratase
MEAEESIRGNPIDAVVLLDGCDKTTPGQLMGAASVDLPTMVELLERGVRDMLRISDARMSGTVVLHVAPESDAGGPLALVRDGDEIVFDGPSRTLDLLISPEELAARAAAWIQHRTAPKYSRGYYRLYVEHVMQADRGCDLDFLTGSSGSIVDRESH